MLAEVVAESLYASVFKASGQSRLNAHEGIGREVEVEAVEMMLDGMDGLMERDVIELQMVLFGNQ